MSTQPQVSLVPPFTRETAVQKVRKAEDGWNSRDPQRVALAYTVDSKWRNRAEFINGREEIIPFLTRKWNSELEYRLMKELWAFDGARIAVRLPTNRATIRGSGIVPTATKTGNSMPRASCITATPASMIYRLRSPSVCFTGPWELAPRTIRDSAIWVCKST